MEESVLEIYGLERNMRTGLVMPIFPSTLIL